MNGVVMASLGAVVVLCGTARADEWMVGYETSNHWCRIERKVPLPRLTYIGGPFATQKLACGDAKGKFDGTGTETGRCSSYFVETASGCQALGVPLPR